MHEQQSSQDLVDEVLDVVVAELLPGVYDSVQVGLHQLSYDVDVVVAGPSLGLEDVEQPHDVVVLEEL